MIYNVGTGGGATSADKIDYDNTDSGLQAENVQDGIDELNSNLTAENSQRFKFGYQDGKYGYWKKEADTDVFVPFSSVTTGNFRCDNSTFSIDIGTDKTLIMLESSDKNTTFFINIPLKRGVRYVVGSGTLVLNDYEVNFITYNNGILTFSTLIAQWAFGYLSGTFMAC